MMERREAEADSQLREAAGLDCGPGIDPHAERLQHVGGAGLARHGPVAVLCHRLAGGRDDDRRRGGDVERARAVATGAAGVGHEAGRRDRQHPGPEGRGDTGDVCRRLAHIGERHEPPAEGLEIDVASEHAGDEPFDVGLRPTSPCTEVCRPGIDVGRRSRIGHGVEWG